MQTQTHMKSEGKKRMYNYTRHRVAAAASVLCMAIAGSALAGNGGPIPIPNLSPGKGIVDLTTNYGASGVIASVVGVSGVSGATDSIEVTFGKPMHPGNFGMGVNFAKAWTKTWNADNTVLTIGGDIDLSDAADPTLIVYLMQTESDRKDISEPNVFKFHDIKITGVKAGNGQIDVEFDNPNIKGYGLYLAKTLTSKFKAWGDVTWHSKGVHIGNMKAGETYRIYLEYLYYQRNGMVATRTAPVAVTIPK
jgi:hypothetical protein